MTHEPIPSQRARCCDTPRPWQRGKHGCSIIDPSLAPGTSYEVEFYGGALVAESVAARNMPLILEAPAMFACLHDMRRLGLFRGVYGDARLAAIAEAERILTVIEGAF